MARPFSTKEPAKGRLPAANARDIGPFAQKSNCLPDSSSL
jgi:hypothetical protein